MKALSLYFYCLKTFAQYCTFTKLYKLNNSPLQKLIEQSAVCKSSSSYTYIFPQSQVFNLMLNPENRCNTTLH